MKTDTSQTEGVPAVGVPRMVLPLLRFLADPKKFMQETGNSERDARSWAEIRARQILEGPNSQPWFMWTENKLSLRDRIKILFGWKIYTRFDAPSGQCSAGCEMRHQITRAKYDALNWQNAEPSYGDGEKDAAT
jgi:hypothetical protein